jgi:hypothetical protein
MKEGAVLRARLRFSVKRPNERAMEPQALPPSSSPQSEPGSLNPVLQLEKQYFLTPRNFFELLLVWNQ